MEFIHKYFSPFFPPPKHILSVCGMMGKNKDKISCVKIRHSLSIKFYPPFLSQIKHILRVSLIES